jgi:hypothetical protein
MRDLELGGVPFESLASRSESRTSQRKTRQHNLQMNFICMPLGRLHAWRLCHVALPVSAVFGIEKSFSIFSVHIEVVGFAVDIEK